MRFSMLLLMSTFLFEIPYAKIMHVVTTIPDYAYFAKEIGKDKVQVKAIVKGDQDAHYVRPKPSHAVLLRKCDLFITTGLDLELWVPSLLDKASNARIRSGKQGYVSASHGLNLLDKPTVLSRSEGGLHVYGNPHITPGPLNAIGISRNILVGLKKVDPVNSKFYEDNYVKLKKRLLECLFGTELLKILGEDILIKMAEQKSLIPFLEKKKYKEKPLIEYLGGWLKKGMTFRDKKIVTYHKNWAYFTNLFGLDVINYVEPKPGIPPSPRHVSRLLKDMKDHKIEVIFAANYFNEKKVRNIAEKVGAKAVVVPMFVGGENGIETYFDLVDIWVKRLQESY